MSTIYARLLASAALAALPVAASAQTASTYVPPKLAKPGTSSASVAGAGEVTVQVFVKKDGTQGASRVIKSSNPLDNDAALQIAKTAGYTPAKRNGAPVDAFYDYVVRFTSNGSAAAPPPAAGDAGIGSGPTAAAYADIRSGKYADAKAKLQAYLQAHPGDAQASTLLGVADGFSGDDDGAAIAFDSVPTIPQQYQTLASQAYVKHAGNMLNASRYKDAESAANRVIALNPNSAEGYYLRGVALANEQNFPAALPDLQKGYDMAKSSKADDKSIAAIGFNLAVAQYNTGAFEAAQATAKDVAHRDPSLQSKLDQAGSVAISNAAVAQANAGKIGDAVATFEAGATQFPSSAGNFYGQAAFIMLTDKKPDYKALKAEADKALAADPTEGRALFVNAFVAAQAGDSKTAVADMNKAKASPLYSSNASFAKQVDDNLKKLTAPSS
jgi:tetratricopeptide (TPR) repeat protein